MSKESPVTCLVKIEAIPDQTQELLTALYFVKKESDKEEGCLDYQILLDQNEPNFLVLIEVFKSKKYFDAHFETDHIQWFMKEIRAKTCIKLYHDLYTNAL